MTGGGQPHDAELVAAPLQPPGAAGLGNMTGEERKTKSIWNDTPRVGVPRSGSTEIGPGAEAGVQNILTRRTSTTPSDEPETGGSPAPGS